MGSAPAFFGLAVCWLDRLLPLAGRSAFSGDFEGVPLGLRMASFLGVLSSVGVPVSERWLMADADRCCERGVVLPLPA